ncbi:primase C-terminal domain-containing protein [Rossellomorea vietnamensis]|uniref:primase C-terminal domain-containing protein n=1 Tax=Rossellomorea vietnamensis TaxID=218284 RepID=UPI00077C54F3|nr:primase C-terminal domain-containing protein [Rossellomorea vietnamensis]
MGVRDKEKSSKKMISPAEIMQFMTHNSLRLYKKKGSKASITRLTAYEKDERIPSQKTGVVFVSPSKDDLSNGKGFVVTSYETLHEKRNSLSHWTPNTYRGGTYYDFRNRVIKGHTRDNLKQINVIGFDIDTKEVDLYALFLGCDELGIPRPNLLLETPRGFQGFFVLETPFFIHRQKEYKALRVAERVADNLLKALKKYVPVDTNCAPFGFYRIPQDGNVIYFDDHPANTGLLLSWSKQFEEKERKAAFQVIYPGQASVSDQTVSEWYRTLIRATHIESGHYSTSRNNALFTLAIANYASGRPLEAAYDELDQFNSNLEHPLKKAEFERILKSAYSGKYKGAKRSYVEGLLELWTNGSAKFKGREGWYKFKKPREERVRSHYDEREEDILAQLHACTSPEKPFFEGSLTRLAETFNMAVSTLKEVIKRSERIIKRTIGRGRNAVTMVASRSVLFQSLLQERKKRIQHAQMTFAEMLPAANQYISELDIPTLVEELLLYELDLLYRSGSSPPTQLIS